jgi:hypothetical protein
MGDFIGVFIEELINKSTGEYTHESIQKAAGRFWQVHSEQEPRACIIIREGRR